MICSTLSEDLFADTYSTTAVFAETDRDLTMSASNVMALVEFLTKLEFDCDEKLDGRLATSKANCDHSFIESCTVVT